MERELRPNQIGIRASFDPMGAIEREKKKSPESSIDQLFCNDESSGMSPKDIGKDEEKYFCIRRVFFLFFMKCFCALEDSNVNLHMEQQSDDSTIDLERDLLDADLWKQESLPINC